MGEGCAIFSVGFNMCAYLCIGLLGIVHTALGIAAVVGSAGDDDLMNIDGAKTPYLILPIVSIIIPNPVTTGISAFTDCTKYNNCDANYRDLYTATFTINIVTIGLGALCGVIYLLRCAKSKWDKRRSI